MAQTLTFAQLKQQARDQNFDGSFVKDERVIARAIRDALKRLGSERDWSFQLTRTRATSVSQYNTGTIAITHGNSIVTGTGTTFATGMNLRFFYPNNGVAYFAVASVTSATKLALQSPYVNPNQSNLSGAAFRIVAPTIDLPSNFRALEKIYDINNNVVLDRMSITDIFYGYLSDGVASRPTSYAIDNKDQTTVRQLYLYPAPDIKYQYELLYYRWPTVPSADADIIDWPDNHREVLHAAVMMQLAQETKNSDWYQMGLLAYSRALESAMKGDEQNKEPILIGRPYSDSRSYTVNRPTIVQSW